MDTLFRISNLLVLPFWALMIVAPRWRWTGRILRSPIVIAAPACVYLALVLPRISDIWPAVTRPTLTGIAVLLGSHAGATIAWFHFLAFDLFVGRWIYLDTRQRGISAWLVSTVLFLTLMIGPVGFLLYLALCAFAPANFQTQDKVESFQRPGEEAEQKAAGERGQIAGLASSLVRKSITRALAMNRPLTISGLVMLLVFAATLVGLVVDHRVITGVPAWLKPAKFAISISIYCFTLVWLLGFVAGRPRQVRLIANVTVVSLLVEMAIIVTQAARGTTSHFNLSTPLNASLWVAMGIFILFVWAMNLLLAILLMFQRMPDRAFALSLRLGVLISAVGMGVAFLMTTPTSAQLAVIAAHGPRVVGAHSVGVADGGPGLPIVGWSTVGGDLRVGHFVGLHALQILPFLGWLFTRKRGRFARLVESQRLALVWTSGLAYLGSVLLLVWQALRGQPLTHPDVKTLLVASLLTAGVAVAVFLITLRPCIASRKARRSAPVNPIPISGGNMKGIVLILVVTASLLPVRSFGQDAAKPIPEAPSVQTETPSGGDSSRAGRPSNPQSSNSRTAAGDSQPTPQIQTNGNATGLRVSEKFHYYASETYLNPAALVGPAFRAGIRMANPPGRGTTLYPREWTQGGEAFGRNYGDAVAERTSFNTARFVSGVILREDPRYVPSNSRNVFARSLRAVSFTFVDRSDSGHCRLALSSFVGAAAGGFVGNAYLPAGFNDLTHAGQRSTLQFGFVAGGNLFREFAPQMPGPLRAFFMLIGR